MSCGRAHISCDVVSSLVLVMSEVLFELLAPHLKVKEDVPKPTLRDSTTVKYLSRLANLQLSSLDSTESQSLAQSAHSNLLSIQALSTRSSKSIVRSVDELKELERTLPDLALSASQTRNGVSTLDKTILKFSEKYSRSGENEVLDRRKQALLMSRNVNRLSDILELPALLASTISASSQQGSLVHTNYASALDLHAYIKRLHQTHPESEVLKSLFALAEASMADMKTNLIGSLRGQNVKLASAMRTISWLRRLIPSLAPNTRDGRGSLGEGSFGALFLACRLYNLLNMLEALEPLRELANQETERRLSGAGAVSAGSGSWASGQQTERYLKRFVEIFREQSFAIVSLFKSIFPADEPGRVDDLNLQLNVPGLQSTLPALSGSSANDSINKLPSALATFPAHLVDLLVETLRTYLPNVQDKSSRESLLTQVMYCAGSLGRLGGDFSMMLALLDEDEEGEDGPSLDWVSVMKKHRVMSGRLESLSSGISSSSKGGPKASSSGPNVKVNG